MACAIVAALAMLLSGCGGGDGADVSRLTETGEPTTPVVPVVPQGTTVGCGGAPGAIQAAAAAASAKATAAATAAGKSPAEAAAAGEAAAEEVRAPSATPDAAGCNEGGEDVANRMANANSARGQRVATSAQTPAKFEKALCRRPIMVVITQPHDILGTAQLIETRAAGRTVNGLVTLEYDAGDFVKQGDLMTMLGLFKTPAVAIVARDGEIENFWTSFVDRGLISRSLASAAAAKRCTGTPADAPAPGADLAAAASLAASGAPASATTSTDGTTVGIDTTVAPAVDAAAPGALAVDPAAAGASVPSV